MQKISWLSIPAQHVDDARMQKLFARSAEVLGFVPNVFLGYTIRPTHFAGWFAHFKEIMSGPGELSPAEREMIAVVVSAENHCLYCLVSHGADLRVKLGDAQQGERISIDHRKAGLDARTVAMLDYAQKLTREPRACGEADIVALRAHGFSEEAIFDIIEITGMYNFTNRLAAGTGLMPNPEYHTMGRAA
jgi:uncharacterized peroxidase-related enzyme